MSDWPDNIIKRVGIEPYYHDEHGVIYCGDCLNIMPKIPEGAVDLVVTSPPYGVGIQYGDLSDDIPDYFESVMRVCKALILIPGYGNHYDLPKPRYSAIWYKPNGMTGGAQMFRFSLWDPILFYGDFGSKRLYGNDVFIEPISIQNTGGHPCPFPLRLVSKLMSKIQADVILDPFLGSGTTAVAAKHLGRRYIGIDIVEKYCEISVDRLRQTEMEFK